MSCVQLCEGVSRWFTPSACGPGHPELSKSYMDMAGTLFTFTVTYVNVNMQCVCAGPRCIFNCDDTYICQGI